MITSKDIIDKIQFRVNLHKTYMNFMKDMYNKQEVNLKKILKKYKINNRQRLLQKEKIIENSVLKVLEKYYPNILESIGEELKKFKILNKKDLKNIISKYISNNSDNIDYLELITKSVINKFSHIRKIKTSDESFDIIIFGNNLYKQLFNILLKTIRYKKQQKIKELNYNGIKNGLTKKIKSLNIQDNEVEDIVNTILYSFCKYLSLGCDKDKFVILKYKKEIKYKDFINNIIDNFKQQGKDTFTFKEIKEILKQKGYNINLGYINYVIKQIIKDKKIIRIYKGLYKFKD